MERVNPLLDLTQSPIHGQGLFAATEIPPGTRLIEYVGRKIDKAESQRQCRLNNPYLFFLDDQHDLDGDVAWNPARFINHSCDPNSDAELVDGRIWIVANRLIRAGEEISFDYGYDLTDYQDYPCRCGAAACRGFIVGVDYPVPRPPPL